MRLRFRCASEPYECTLGARYVGSVIGYCGHFREESDGFHASGQSPKVE